MEKEFTDADRIRMYEADGVSLPVGNGWSLRTQFQNHTSGSKNFPGVKTLPIYYDSVDTMINRFLSRKEEWNQHFVDFINAFGLAALIAAKYDTPANVIDQSEDTLPVKVIFEGKPLDPVVVREVHIDFEKRLISVAVMQ